MTVFGWWPMMHIQQHTAGKDKFSFIECQKKESWVLGHSGNGLSS